MGLRLLNEEESSMIEEANANTAELHSTGLYLGVVLARSNSNPNLDYAHIIRYDAFLLYHDFGTDINLYG